MRCSRKLSRSGRREKKGEGGEVGGEKRSASEKKWGASAKMSHKLIILEAVSHGVRAAGRRHLEGASRLFIVEQGVTRRNELAPW
jgi:hypothetical protein